LRLSRDDVRLLTLPPIRLGPAPGEPGSFPAFPTESMPRYFFHFGDGKHTFTDSIGVELDGMADVRKNTIAQIHDIKCAGSERQIQNWSGWQMIVTNVDGIPVFVVRFDLNG
jgi:uncharacterized protein DUF6894